MLAHVGVAKAAAAEPHNVHAGMNYRPRWHPTMAANGEILRRPRYRAWNACLINNGDISVLHNHKIQYLFTIIR